MRRSNFWIAAAIIAAVIFVAFLVSVPHAGPVESNTFTAATSTPTAPYTTVSDSYRRGVHTITGSILAPNPCTTLTATSTLQGTASTSQSIVVDITMPKDTGVCLQEPATTTYSTTLTAPKSLPIQVTVNGLLAATSTP